MMLDKIFQFIQTYKICPVCQNKLNRSMFANFYTTKKVLEYVSNSNSKFDYEDFVFRLYWFDLELGPAVERDDGTLDDNNYLREVSGVPSIINIKEKTPPVINAISFKKIIVTCPEKHYYIASDQSFEASIEKFNLDGLSIYVTERMITEEVNKTKFETRESQLVKHTGASIVNFVRKIGILS